MTGKEDSGGSAAAVEIAAGVRRVSVGSPVASHVYLLDAPTGPVAFDAGVRGSGREILAAAGGRIDWVLLSHSHPDHRGGAGELDAPVHCHPDEVADAEGDGGRSYAEFERIEDERARRLAPRLTEAWDGGPVEIAGTVAEGERVAGFQVVHTPGHAPGQIALFREADRLLLAADAVFTIDAESGRPSAPQVAKPFSNWDTDRARDSIRRLAALRPSAVWPAHGEPILGDGAAARLARASGQLGTDEPQADVE